MGKTLTIRDIFCEVGKDLSSDQGPPKTAEVREDLSSSQALPPKPEMSGVDLIKIIEPSFIRLLERISAEFPQIVFHKPLEVPRQEESQQESAVPIGPPGWEEQLVTWRKQVYVGPTGKEVIVPTNLPDGKGRYHGIYVVGRPGYGLDDPDVVIGFGRNKPESANYSWQPARLTAEIATVAIEGKVIPNPYTLRFQTKPATQLIAK
jgi:hypothetical protein